MRLLYVSHSFPPIDRPLANIGGMQRVAVELSEALAALPDIEFKPLVLRSSWRWIHVTSPGWLLATMMRILHRAKRRDFDVVLFSSMVSASMAPFLRRRLNRAGIPMAAIAHGLDVTQPGIYQRVLVRRILGALDAVLPVSRATGRECRLRGMPEHRVHVIPNGVNPHRGAAASSNDALSTLGAPKPSLLLCSVGRLVERKGFAWFVDHVMPLLPQSVHYWIAGSGPQVKAIEDATFRQGLSDRVRLLGRLDDASVTQLYRSADLLIVPNIPVPGDMEGFGVVMLEAGVSATPTIAARLEGIQDVITEGKNGHLVRSGHAQAFVDAILPYFRDRETLRKASRRAADHTTATFNWTIVASSYASTLRAIVCAARSE